MNHSEIMEFLLIGHELTVEVCILKKWTIHILLRIRTQEAKNTADPTVSDPNPTHYNVIYF